MSRTTPVIDREHLARATGNDPSLMRELLGMLRRELPDRRHQLESALERNDLEAAAGAVHKIRGSASYTGALDLKEAAEVCEASLRSGETRDLQRLDEAIDALLDTLADEARFTREAE